MHFEFKSSSLDLIESFWQFEITEQNIVVPFLLVGQTRDPAVAFDRSHINFRSVLIGQLAFISTCVVTEYTAAAAADLMLLIKYETEVSSIVRAHYLL